MFGVPSDRDGETWSTATMGGRRMRLPWERSSSFLPAVWALVPLPSKSWWPLHPMVTLSQLLRKIKMPTPPSSSDAQWLSWQLQAPFLRCLQC